VIVAVEWADFAAVGALAVAVVALIVSIWTAMHSATAARRERALAVSIDLFREARDLGPARRDVFFEIAPLETCRLDELPASLRDSAQKLCWFYDNVGVLVAHRMVDIEPIAGYLGDSILDSWDRLERFILAERAHRRERSDARADAYQWYFEELVTRLRKPGRSPAAIRQKLAR